MFLRLLFLGLVSRDASCTDSMDCLELLRSPPTDFLETRDFDKLSLGPHLYYDDSHVANEHDLYLFRYGMAKGGGMIAIGGDQAYTLVSFARGRGAEEDVELWIYDYDPRTIGVHRVIQILMLGAENPARFMSLLHELEDPAQSGENLRWLESRITEPGLAKILLKLVQNSKLSDHFTRVQERVDPRGRPFSFLNDPHDYSFVRQLFLRGRVHVYLGSHFNEKLFAKIGREARELGVQINNIYLSNASEIRWMGDAESLIPIWVSGMANKDRLRITEIYESLLVTENAIEATTNPLSTKTLIGSVNEYSGLADSWLDLLPRMKDNWDSLGRGLMELSLTGGARVLVTSSQTLDIMGIEPARRMYHGFRSQTEPAPVDWEYVSMNALGFRRALQKPIKYYFEEWQKKFDDVVSRARASAEAAKRED
jgi:hypothetical protein